MSSGMNMQEAEKVAEKMSYRQAVINCLYARCVPYRKATKIKMQQLIEIAEKQDEKIKHDKQIRAEAIDELKPFFDVCEELVFDWICDDLCGEFINPDTDESWCAEHCHNCTGYECIKKWCELKQMKEQGDGM